MRFRYWSISSSVILLLIFMAGSVVQASEFGDVSQQDMANDNPMQSTSVTPKENHRVHRDPETGKALFLTTPAGKPIARSAALAHGVTSQEAAISYLRSYGGLFGLKAPERELRLMREKSGDRGRSSIRYQQVYEGVPVMGGELIVNLDRNQNLLSINGELSTIVDLDLRPQTSANSAQFTAIQTVASSYDIEVEKLETSTPELWIFDPTLLEAPGPRTPSLVWRLEVIAKEGGPVNELVLVDAKQDRVTLHFSQIDTFINRIIYDNNNSATPGLPGSGPARGEFDPATTITEVDNAYDYIGYTYAYYQIFHGRLGIEDLSSDLASDLVATVRYCPSVDDCPWDNAMWNRTQMAFGDNNASADDIVAHEYTHGVTQHESGLYYYKQSGAINESLSDIWGEFIDQTYTNGLDDDSPGALWLIGEDISSWPGRSMSDPPSLNQPDRMTHIDYYCGSEDGGGVHINSGVGNKAAYLMANGGVFNGYNVVGLGIEKTSHIWYEAQTRLLTSASNYRDLGLALDQACQNLAGTHGITLANCQHVRDAAAAVEMHLEDANCDRETAPLCDELEFYSEFKGGSAGWHSVSGTWLYNPSYIFTYGEASKLSSMRNDSSFSDLEFTVRMKRYGCNTCANGVIIQATPLPLSPDGNWDSGYFFAINRLGQFGVFRFEDGSYTTFKAWSYHEAINIGDAENRLRVVMNGKKLYFYLDKILLWSGIDPDPLRGDHVGFMMFRTDTSSGDELRVTDAKLTGGTPLNIFSDGFENPLSRKWSTSAMIGDDLWWIPQNSNPLGWDVSYPATGNYLAWGYASRFQSDMRLTSVPYILLPSGKSAYLHFKHAYDFHFDNDGGVVEYRTGPSPTWKDADLLFTHGGYNEVIDSTTNPLDGRDSFSRESHGMSSSRLDLSTLAGDNIQFRFRLVTDDSTFDKGWYIDDVRVYTCEDQVSKIYLPLTITGGDPPNGDFHTTFNGDAPGWSQVSGDWDVNNIYLTSEGESGSFVSYRYPVHYSDFVFEARMKRYNCDTCANQIKIRGYPYPLGSSDDWEHGYSFSYSNSYSYSVYKTDGGVWSYLKTWTGTGAVHKNSWNVLRVEASGDNLSFYINDQLVWSGSNSSFSTGHLGFGMWSNGGWDPLMIDWATLVVTGAAVMPDFGFPRIPNPAPLIPAVGDRFNAPD